MILIHIDLDMEWQRCIFRFVGHYLLCVDRLCDKYAAERELGVLL